MAQSDWEDSYDKGISTLVREVLTVIEGTISEEGQRRALRQIIRRTIYNITDKIKDDMVASGLQKKSESYRYPR